jgi:hypothetical protein
VDTILQPIDGRAIIEVDLGTAQSPDPLLTPGQFVFDWGSIEEPIGLWKRWTLRVQASDRIEFESRIKPKLTGDRLVRVRLGISQGSGRLWRAWETHYLLSVELKASSVNATQVGYTYILRTVDRLYTLHLDERLRTQHGTVSEIVSRMADEHGFPGASVEGTRDKFSFIQSYETDWSFLKDRLLVSAINTKGLSNYQLYAQDDQLHFHTPGWQVTGVKSLVYNSAFAGARELTLLDRGGEALQEAAGGVRVIGYTPISGESPTSNTNPSVALKFAQTLPDLAHVRTHLRHTGQNQLALTLAEAQSRYESGRLDTFRIAYMLDNQPFLRPGDIVSLRISEPDDSWAGLYHLSRSTLVIKSGRIHGSYMLSRGELSSVQEDFSGLRAVDPSALAADNTAPGVAYNTAVSSTASLVQGTGVSQDEQGNTVLPVQPHG